MPQQLALSLTWPDQATFDNFYATPANTLLLHYLSNFLDKKTTEKYVYLHGPESAGLSHLLYAVCHAAQKQVGGASYVSFKNNRISFEILEGLEHIAFVCLDDIHRIHQKKHGEEALLHFYNRLLEMPARLIIAGRLPPSQIAWNVLDLQSRLASGPVFKLHPLSDSEKVAALCLRAKNRGLDFCSGVGAYLVKHYRRDMHALFQALTQLDQASLAHQRPLTIPFVKQILKIT